MIRNEKVDEEAKKAAQGSTSMLHRLPPFLQKELPKSATALKQDHLTTLQNQWKTRWENSPRYGKMSNIDETFPLKKYWKIRNTLTRAQASLTMQLRSGHIPLNKFLHRIKKIEFNKCLMCFQIMHQATPETVKHFFFECPAHKNE